MLKKSLNKTTTATAALLTLLAAPGAALACSDSPYIGTICTVAFDYCPTGFVQANGQTLPLNQNQALFALLGTRYGGDGKTTFGVPDLRGRVVVGTGQGVITATGAALTPVVLAKQRGAESVALTTNQMAPHIHTATFTGTGGGGASGSATASGNISLNLTGTTTAAPVTGTVTANVLTTQTTGSTANAPSNANNTLGKFGGSNTFYPSATASAVNSPTTLSLTAPSTAINGTASGNVSLPVTGATGGGITGGTVAVAPNATGNLPVTLVNPGLGLTVCIATTGLYPARD